MIRLSPTTGLNLFRNCPRCFWLHYNKQVRRPRGIFPSLPGGMDLVIKKYFDRYRGKLPPEIEGKVEGCLMPGVELMNKWRNWRTGLEYHRYIKSDLISRPIGGSPGVSPGHTLSGNNFFHGLAPNTTGSSLTNASSPIGIR
ncbi:MAG: hypothetical protein SCARUB_04585 [Candidatus Scalindua rubra]|uniref:Uncharacterized protein n=1 Tax=Candidatus Scalindua rubra TaxID=1872076 RepID=A0A1E3X427_9BACT|nr:MAG: hypothetical protein SCARUB_04585 [Candidatus Scalindua rubra]